MKRSSFINFHQLSSTLHWFKLEHKAICSTTACVDQAKYFWLKSSSNKITLFSVTSELYKSLSEVRYCTLSFNKSRTACVFIFMLSQNYLARYSTGCPRWLLISIYRTSGNLAKITYKTNYTRKIIFSSCCESQS